MIKSFTLNNTSDSILSRICLVSLIWLLLILGGFTTRAWGRTSSVNTAALWKSSTYSTGDSVVWSAPNVTFKLHNGGNIELYLNDHILIQKNRHYTLEWRVAEGYTINVTKVSVRARSSEQAYMTVSRNKSGNIYSNTTYTTVNSQDLSLGNTDTVHIYPQSDDREAAIIHMDEITVTYTMNGVEKEVTFDATGDRYSTAKYYEPAFFKEEGTHVDFYLYSSMKKYRYNSSKYFYLKENNSTAELSWNVATGYTIAVKSISFTGKGNGSKTKGYLLANATNDWDHQVFICDKEESFSRTYNYSTQYPIHDKDFSNYLFGSGGTPFGNNGKFYFKVGKYSGIGTPEVDFYTITLTYTINPNSYDITLNDENGGTSSVAVTYDANNQLSIENPTKYGYTFDGWYSGETDGNGSGTKVIDVDGNLQANITVGGTVYTGAEGVWKKTTATTLYAKWILNSDKTITLSNQSATIAGTASITVRYNTNGYSNNPIDVPAKTGYTFDGYYSAISGGVQIIDAGGNVVASAEGYTDSSKNWINGDEETTLYAHWTGVPYSVRFNGTEKTAGSMSNQAFTYGTAQNLTANAFSKTCTVTYDANGGDAVASSVTSFAFEGWAETAGGAKKYDDEQEVSNLTSTEDAVVDLYAKWSAEADSVKLPMPTKENYAFAGWYDANEDSIGSAGDTIAPTGSMTLKAHWRPGVGLTKESINAGGDIVVTTEHVRFRLHSEDYSIVSGDDGGFKVWDDMPTNTTKNVTLTWEKTLTNGSYDITVTRITFKAKAYNSNYFNSQYGQMSFNGGGDFCIGTNSPWEDKGWSSTIGGNGTYASGVIIKLINTKDAGLTQTFDYHIKDFQIEYTITPHTPNASNTDLAGTLSLDAKQTVDVSTLFSLSHPASDFEYTYRLKEAYANAGMDGTNFYATRSGDYEVQGCIALGTDHEASAWSTATIHVTRTCVFDNGKRGGDKDWQKTTNWDYGIKPDDTDAVRVIGDLTIDESISVLSLAIEDTAIVNIAPTGGLTVGAGGISGATKDKLILRADKGAAKSARKGQTGYLRISPEYTGAMPEAALELYSVAYNDMSRSGDDVAVWQAVGAPISDAGVSAKSVYTKSWIYSWDEEADDWVNNRKTLTFKPFTGYITSQYKYPEGITLTYNGHIVSGRTSQVIDLAYSGEGKGHNLLANSYAAPIDISRFNVGDFYHATPTIYIQNAGTCAESSSQMDGISAEKAAAPGQYLAIPINTAASLASTYNYPVLIPAMQGFWVDATADDGTLTLDYNRLVWNADYSTHPNVPLRAPQYKAQEVTENESEEMPQVGSLQISLEANGWYDNLFMLESERYNTAYEPGSDALKKESGTLNIFTLENDDKLAIDATNSILGTRVGVRTGEETAYTMTFSHVDSQEELALYDSETEQTIDINEGTQYTFFAESNAMITERFEIVARADAPAITTGVDKVENGAKVHKFIKDNQLFILKNGVLYNATGAVVR